MKRQPPKNLRTQADIKKQYFWGYLLPRADKVSFEIAFEFLIFILLNAVG